MIRTLLFSAPSLARYQSEYGINFAEPISVKYRRRRMLDRQIPLAVRLFAGKHKTKHGVSNPHYLDNRYLETTFDLKSMAINNYIDPGKINDPELMSRALSIELLLKHVN